MKKILVTMIGGTFLPVILLANPLQSHNPAFKGILLNLSAGFTQLSAAHKTAYNRVSSTTDTTTFSKESLSANGGNIKLGVGYGINFKENYNWSSDVYYFYNSLKATKFTPTDPSVPANIRNLTNVSLERKDGMGFKTALGYSFHPMTLVYGGLVVERSLFKFKLGEGNLFPTYTKTSKFLWGIGPVIGTKIAFSDHTSLMVEAQYIAYQPFSKQGFAQLSPTVSHRFKAHTQPNTLSVNIGLSYKI